MSRRQGFRGVCKPCCVAFPLFGRYPFLQLWTHKITTRVVLWIQHVPSAPHWISARALTKASASACSAARVMLFSVILLPFPAHDSFCKLPGPVLFDRHVP